MKRQNYRLFQLLPLLILLIAAQGKAQITSVDFLGDYVLGVSKKLAVTSANGIGGSFRLNYSISDAVSISLTTGYQSFGIDQDSMLTQWKWAFWDNRYYGSIRADLNDTSSGLSATFTPEQSMSAIPVMLTGNYQFNLSENLSLKVSAGAGVYFYVRSMYVVEDWTKVLKGINTTFKYAYRNFAPDKRGNPVMAAGGVNLSYKLIDFARVAAEFNYNYLIPTEGKLGYDEAPFKDFLNIKLGIIFSY